MMISGLGYFAIDTSASAKWYELLTKVLGMGAEQGAGVTFYRLDEWHHRIAVYESDSDAVRAVGWQLDDEWALGEMVRPLEDAGVVLSPMSEAVCEERRVTAGYQFLDPVSSMPTEIFYGPVY